MKKVIATIVKEWILMRRDVAGIMLLLIMPAVLIIVMALVEDAPFRDYQEIKFDLLFADNDHSRLSNEIQEGLKHSTNFNPIDSIDGQPLSEAGLKELLKKGKYTTGIVIPKGATAEMVNSANEIANDMSKRLGMGASLPTRRQRDSLFVNLYFDPVAKPTLRSAISSALDKYITASYTKMLISRVSGMYAAPDTGQTTNEDPARLFSNIGVREVPLDKQFKQAYINSVQHNVPAWAIFGMFFIALPISSHLIKERREGSALRIALIPNVQIAVSLGSIIFYTLVCTIQFICMFCIGIWVMPLLGLPALNIGTHPLLLLLIAICVAFTATTYGYLVGAIFKTSNQAMPFASISIVILSAIGGIWVPINIFPPTMQKIALISPLNWGLQAINDVILRNATLGDVVPYLGILMAFGVVALGTSIYINKHQKNVR